MSKNTEKIKQLTEYLKELTEEFNSITAEAKLIHEGILKDPLNGELVKRMADNKRRLGNGKKSMMKLLQN